MKVEYDIVYFFVYCLSVLSNAKNVLVIVGKTAIEKKILPWSFVITYSPEHRGLLRFVFPLYCRVARDSMVPRYLMFNVCIT